MYISGNYCRAPEILEGFFQEFLKKIFLKFSTMSFFRNSYKNALQKIFLRITAQVRVCITSCFSSNIPEIIAPGVLFGMFTGVGKFLNKFFSRIFQKFLQGYLSNYKLRRSSNYFLQEFVQKFLQVFLPGLLRVSFIFFSAYASRTSSKILSVTLAKFTQFLIICQGFFQEILPSLPALPNGFLKNLFIFFVWENFQKVCVLIHLKIM